MSRFLQGVAMMSLVLVSVPQPAWAAQASASIPASVRTSIENDINKEIAAGRLTGVSVALVSHGRIVWEQGFGWADQQEGRKVTAHTPFSIASTTKPFTTTALMTLVAAGKIKLDHPGNEYLGKAKIVDESGPANGVTVMQMATHSAGLPSLFAMYLDGTDDHQPSVDQMLEDYGHTVALPGEHYAYSNVGMGALAGIVARQSGMEYGQYLQKAVLAPLGLHDTFFDTDVSRRSSMAVRYTDDGKPLPFYLTPTPGSGEVMSSAHDLARFAMFHLKDHLPDQEAILTDAQIDQLHAPHSDVAPPGFFYGMGWQVHQTDGKTDVLYHGGGQTGVDAEFVLLPGADVACIVLNNRHADEDFITGVRDRLIQAIAPSWKGIPKPPVSAPMPLTADYQGTWQGTVQAQGHRVNATLVIDKQGKGTFAIEGQSPAPITDLGIVDGWLSGDTTGRTGASDAERAKLTKLSLGLKLRGDTIDGEIDAWDKTPASMTILPFWAKLTRQP
ncbi:serine hydrolase domain-containing protein [Pinirhizobacter soli]|uniref:serine hydrolase domain-containing protein n=1 Tax=Pinirhizobacter soli TaxID=2786953 RepID=UPI002029FF5D|nr:serine hydrolase domain-containing protein [Pinirhizobacter soli]